MVAYTKPQLRKEEKSERLRGERDQRGEIREERSERREREIREARDQKCMSAIKDRFVTSNSKKFLDHLFSLFIRL